MGAGVGARLPFGIEYSMYYVSRRQIPGWLLINNTKHAMAKAKERNHSRPDDLAVGISQCVVSI